MKNEDIIKTHLLFTRIIPKIFILLPRYVKAVSIAARKEPKPLGLGWILERAVKKNPDGNAILYEDIKISYRDFNAAANKISNYLINEGYKKGDVAVLFIENRPELLACVAGCAKVGVICAMVNTSLTDKALINNINIAKPDFIVIGEELVDSFKKVRSKLEISSKGIFYAAKNGLQNHGRSPKNFINIFETVKDCSTDNPDTTNKIGHRDACFYVYTSGTTGLPKAAIFSHGRVVKAYCGFGIIAMNLKKHEVLYSTLPLYHSTAMIMGWGSAMINAAGFAMRAKFSAREFWNDCRKYNAVCFCYVGELCRYLMNQPGKPDDADNPVRAMLGTGLRPAIWKDFKKRFGINTVFESYASSEGPIGFANFFNFDNTVGTSPEAFAVIKYDKENEKPIKNKKGFMIKVKKGDAGLLISKITETAPFDGYTEKKESDKCVLRDVFVKGDAWFNSGDYMRVLGCNHLQFVDRLGDTYRWKGENVSTTEVENIFNSFSNVSEAVAYGVEIPNTNGRAGMASIKLDNKKKKPDYNKLYEHLSNSLPSYAVPIFIRLRDDMVTTGTFKYKKTDLKEDAYHIDKTGDPLYVALPGEKTYISLTPEVYKGIVTGKYKY